MIYRIGLDRELIHWKTKIEKLFSRENNYIDADCGVSDQYEVCVRKALLILDLGGAHPKRTK